MGKRKKSSRGPQGPKKSEGLPTVFTCLFCNHEKSVTVKIDKKAGIGQLDCKVCGQKFQCSVNCKEHLNLEMACLVRKITTNDAKQDLSAAVDVYGEWVDAADAVAKEDSAAAAASYGGTSRPAGRRLTNRATADDDDERQYDGEGIVGDDVV